MDDVLHIRLGTEFILRIEDYGRKRQLSRNDVVRIAVTELLNKPETKRELLRRHDELQEEINSISSKIELVEKKEIEENAVKESQRKQESLKSEYSRDFEFAKSEQDPKKRMSLYKKLETRYSNNELFSKNIKNAIDVLTSKIKAESKGV